MIRRLVVAALALAGVAFVVLGQGTVVADVPNVAVIGQLNLLRPHDPTPVDETCVSCHEAHNARDDCTSCHVGSHVSVPVDGTCVSCHEAHNARDDCTSCHVGSHVSVPVDGTCVS